MARPDGHGGLGVWVPLALALVLFVGLVYVLWPRPVPLPAMTTPTATPLPSSSVPALLPVPTLEPTPTHTIQRPPRPTPPPGGQIVVLTPAPEAVGWASDLDGRAHFNVPNIHVGTLNRATYHGALQFDLASLPPDATITAATLELTGLSAEQLTGDGIWRLQLLASALDAEWPALSFEALHRAPGEATIALSLTAAHLGTGQVNAFPFDAAALAVLEARRATGLISLRLDGPTGPADNLFTWDTGYRLNRELETRPALVVALAPMPPAQYVIVTSVPTPANVLTVAAQAARATEIAATIGTFTPTPRHWVTPIIVTPRPTAANAATAAYERAAATAEALLYGTATPTPPNVWTATPLPSPTATPTPVPTLLPPATPTPTPTPVFVLLEGQLPTFLLRRTPTATPAPVPAVLVGKIAFLSDRATLAADPRARPLSDPLVYVINPDGSGLALLTDRWPYDQAVQRDRLSADQRYRAFVKDVSYQDGARPAVFYFDALYRIERQVTAFGSGAAYSPAWSPVADRIVLVSNDSGNDEIWTIGRDGSTPRQLTRDPFGWWDKHPSWSPDGRQIVFWSNRSGRRQIWVMDAEGGNLRTLSGTEYNDWDPVWIKYTDPPWEAVGE